MNVLANTHLVNASKDISNGGIFGTLMQMIKYSNVSANININEIEIPPILLKNNYDLETYIKMYLTTSYILTVSENNSQKVIEIFKEHDMDAQVIGNITKERNLLTINDGKESIDVIRF
jgi:selenophosphate synthetase-related protein